MDQITSMCRLDVDTRISFAAACHKRLGNSKEASEKLQIAQVESGMDIEKFVATQLFQDQSTSKLAIVYSLVYRTFFRKNVRAG